MEESIVKFCEQWADEFARAIEMFGGERPAIVQQPAEANQVEEWEAKRGEFQWWRQETEDPRRFKVWVGAAEACWSALAGERGEGSDAKDLFQEMLSQANQGAAAAVSGSSSTPIKFGAIEANAPASLTPLRVAQVTITFRDAALPPLIVALEPEAATILDDLEVPQPAKAPANALPAAPGGNLIANASMIERLLDLQLPVSVLLGQTVLPIREALKISSGSLIELDRQLGDYVEVMVHGTVVARGEIVSIKGNYGVRIKEVISRQDRFALKDVA